jgi:polysaccharide biosynthesis transport protein
MQMAPIEFLKKRWGWRWIPLVVALLILACTALYAWMRPELYRSETRILVEPKTVFDRELSAAEIKESVENQIQNVRQMLESRTILQRIADEFKLRSDDTSVPMEDALKAIRNNLEVMKTPGNTFAMAYHAASPQAAQAITKRLAEVLIEMNREAQRNKAMEKHEFLTMELAKAKDELGTINVSMLNFRRSNPGERQDSVEQMLLRDQARAQRHVDQID